MKTEHIERVNEIINQAEDEIRELTGMACSITMNLEADITIVEIRKLIEEELNVTYKEIAGRSRMKHIVIARFLYIWFLRKHYKKTLYSIAEELGRDHTSIVHAMHAIQEWFDTKDYLIMIPFKHIQNILNSRKIENKN